MTSLSEIVNYTNDFLRVREIGDWDNALNGLQIENSGGVSKIGASVDASTRVLAAAAKQNVDLLVVHHGLFWPGLRPVTGTLCRRLKSPLKTTLRFTVHICRSTCIHDSAIMRSSLQHSDLNRISRSSRKKVD